MKSTLKTRPGIQSRLARKSGIPQSVISCLFSGRRRATPEQAVALEPLLIAEGINVTRIDLVFCPRGTKLMDLVRRTE